MSAPRRFFSAVMGLSVFLIMAACCLVPLDVALARMGDEPLSYWNNTPAKQRIIAFVDEVTDPLSDSYVAEEMRLAAFDLDGTLFCEKPLYLQVLVAAEGLYDLAEKDPTLREEYPYNGAWKRDMEFISDSKNFLEMNLTAFAGMTQEEYQAYVRDFLRRDHPKYGVPYDQLFYSPMEELLRFLRDNGFQIYLVSGSPQEFIRSFSVEILDVQPERVIGDTISIDFEIRDGEVAYVRKHDYVKPEVLKAGKPVNIRLRTGRSPILAFGNSSDDIQMLESAGAGGLPSLALTLRHDDAEREYAYDKGAEKMIEVASENGWVIVSMKEDFKTVFENIDD
ncbi:MAG: haloacid dehalogenase-like hydrolase [Candidatus Omnitrophica bacterium]|nr:haloacid dehalogenase-like hydrolase [Candidatus Omnitrophota bacterium]MBU1783908.1 haloacid dehalogenase-like hydrolase [Candidatus Omnitrophota bacterium]